LLFSAVIPEHFSMLSVVVAKIWYLEKCAFFIGPRYTMRLLDEQDTVTNNAAL